MSNSGSDLQSNLDDIQGILIRGYRDLEAACFVLLHVETADAARRWLGSVVGEITDGQTRPSDVAINVAFTYAGLEALGLKPKTLGQFSRQFQEGMTTAYRQRILGDHGDSAPDKWDWGGPNTEPVHILLMLYATTDAKLIELYSAQAEKFKTGGLTEIHKKLETMRLKGGKEHFGFQDGISQPWIVGLKKTTPESNLVKPGEFILGYLNEYDQYTDRPMVDASEDEAAVLPAVADSNNHDFGRNGSYLVFRQLLQHVQEFWRFMDETTQDSTGQSDAEARDRLASKMVGRWRSGAPMTVTPDKDDPNLGLENDFLYHKNDSHGFGCPLGAHVRRTNPRDSLEPKPGSAESIAINKRHRILRRGRSYGPPVAPSMEPADILNSEESSEERGLHFICFNANISRQFEFIQHTWANNQHFVGMYRDADPIIGDNDPRRLDEQGAFTIQAVPVRQRVTGLPRFITVRGGAYFFMPGIRAIRYLASIS